MSSEIEYPVHRAEITMQMIDKEGNPVIGVETPAVYTIGGYSFEDADGKVICVDFENMASNYYSVTGRFESSVSSWDPCMDEANEEQGYKPGSVTGSLLQSCKLIEVHYECYADVEENEFLLLKPIQFSLFEWKDGIGEIEHKLTEDQLNAYFRDYVYEGNE